MRKFLSVVLAMVMILTNVSMVIAAPTAATGVESVVEFNPEGGEMMAELAADAGKLYRGINLFTGTKDAFDGDNYTDFSSWLQKGEKTSLDMISVVDDPTGVKDKVLQFEIPANFDAAYPNFYIDFGGDIDTDIGHTYVYFAFDYQKYVSDMSGYITNNAFWMLNTYPTSGDFAPINHDVAANEGWRHYGKVIDFSVNSTGKNICSTDNPYYSSQDINKKIIFQFGNNTDNTVPVQFLFDNLVFAPAYKVTYYNKAGTSVVNEEYVVVDEDGNLLSSFAPVTLLSDGKAYGNWSASVGGSVLSEVALADNADIELYATTEEDVFGSAKIVLDKKLTKKGDKAVATAVFGAEVDFDPEKVTWSVADKDVAIVNYDADKELATVTAMGAGTTEITFDYDGTSFTDTITVADGPVVAENVTSGSAVSEFEGLDLDVYEYITFNVTNTSGSDKSLSVSLNDADTGSDIGFNYSTFDVTVPASAQNMDVYIDLSDEEAWTGSVESIKVEANGVTINNAKLWAELRVENGIDIVTEKNFLTLAGSSTVAEVFCSSDLEGVYTEEFTITVDADSSVATYRISGNTVTVNAVKGNGVVTINAVNTADPSVSASKEILVNVIEGRNIAYKWDFNNASNTGFTVSQRYTGTIFNGSTANIVAANAVLPGTTDPVPVELSKGTVGGKSVTIVKTYENLYGTMATKSVPSGISVVDHPYLVIKARASSPKSHKLGLYMAYGKYSYDETERKINTEVSLTTEWKYFVIDASTSAANGHGEDFSGMMFSTQEGSVISSEIKQSGSTYYIEGEVQYNPYNNIEIDEMFFANYDPNKVNYGVSLKADKTSVSGDGLVTLYPEVFADGEIANDSVNYSVDKDGYVSILKNSDGTATVTPLRDGTVTITASSVMDETAKDTVTLTLSDIPRRTVAYDLKLMLIGNSYLEHAYLAAADKDLYNGYLNKNDIPRGMAATEPELDYYSRLCYYLTNGFEGTFDSKKQGGAVIEQAWKQGLASGTPGNLTGWDRDASLKAMKLKWEPILDYMDREQPNLITIQLAENAAHAYEESAEWFYNELFTVIDEHRPENSVVVIISPMGTCAASKVQSRIAANYGFYWADNTWIGDDYGWKEDNPYLAFKYYPNYTNAGVVEFRSHPGNEGMDELAKSAYAIFAQQIPTTIPANLVTIPEEIEITGNSTITTKNGTAKLYASVSPESSTPNVIWSVDNANIATVDETGLVTALLNGTVNVTATSAYDETVKDTYTVTITGQTQHYTLTYAAGTSDTVTGLPESFEYAAGDYEFPELVAPPERNGYKFLGWSEKVDGNVQTSVEMTGAKTVYAVWAFADNWNFDKDGELEGIEVAGFNTKVEGGVMSTISYDGIAVGFQDKTLLLNADLYTKFKTNISMSTVNSGDYFTLTVITDKGNKTYKANTLVGANEYTFDISDAEGMITGFSLFTSNDADGVGMTVDYAKFVKTEVKEDKDYGNLDVTSYTILETGNFCGRAANVTVASGATLYLGAGTYIFENLSNAGRIEASENANVIIKNGDKPANYVEINIGAKNGATRYAEINGNEYVISGDENVYGMLAGGKKLLLEITLEGAETSLAADGSDVVTRYFLVDGTDYTEIVMGNYNACSSATELVKNDKTENKNGAKFFASVNADFDKSKAYTVTEHGFIVGLEQTLTENGEQLNFNATKFVSAKAFVRGEFNKVVNAATAAADGFYEFAGIFYGAPAEDYNKRLVVKTYTKVIVDGEEFVVYGLPVTESFYSLAKKNPDSDISDEIVGETEDFDDGIGLPGDDLWD